MAGIYVHIPFCVKKCLYCDFVSSFGTEAEMADYKRSLLKEIEQTPIKEQADTVFIGGGTPSVFPADGIAELLEGLERKAGFCKDCEITIEVNPGTVTMEKLQAYRRAGINRLSIGLQSAKDSELQCLGRLHRYEDFLFTYERARNAGFDNINIDLMAALPGQTLASYQETLQQVLLLAPEHISAYSLILEEGTPLYANRETYTFPEEDEEREMYYLTKGLLEKKGYHRYEISNYAKEGYECRHNLKYWNREDYYGFGTAAASLVDNVRYTNTADRDAYIAAAGDPATLRTACQVLTIEEQMEEFMFLGLRKMDGISGESFKDAFGIDIGQVYGQVIQNAREGGLLAEDAHRRRLFLTDRGIDVSNRVMAEFLL